MIIKLNNVNSYNEIKILKKNLILYIVIFLRLKN